MLAPQRLLEHLVEHGSDTADAIARALGVSVEEVVAAAERLDDVTVAYGSWGSSPGSAYISHESDVKSEVEHHTIRYVGSPSFASLFHHELEEAGIAVVSESPEGRRGKEELVHAYVISLAAAGTVEAIRAVINRFRERYPRAQIEIDPEDDGGREHDAS